MSDVWPADEIQVIPELVNEDKCLDQDIFLYSKRTGWKMIGVINYVMGIPAAVPLNGMH